jgi:hypothetical protein
LKTTFAGVATGTSEQTAVATGPAARRASSITNALAGAELVRCKNAPPSEQTSASGES